MDGHANLTSSQRPSWLSLNNLNTSLITFSQSGSEKGRECLERSSGVVVLGLEARLALSVPLEWSAGLA